MGGGGGREGGGEGFFGVEGVGCLNVFHFV